MWVVEAVTLHKKGPPHLGGKQGRYGRPDTGMAGQPEPIRQLVEAGRGWPRLKAALSLLWRSRGVREGELAGASGRLFSAWRRTGKMLTTSMMRRTRSRFC